MTVSWRRCLGLAMPFALLAAGCAVAAPPAVAADGDVVRMPTPWGIDFQTPSSPVMVEYNSLWVLLLVIVTAITAFVSALLLWVMIRYNRRVHPVASRTAHNTVIEVIWTVLPVLILVVIAIPSFKALYYGDRDEHAEMTVEVTGYQWYWGYKYPDPQYDIPEFDSRLVDERLDSADAKALVKARKDAGQYTRLLSVSHPLVLPVDTSVRVSIKGSDVIHSWAVPSAGVKRDAVPGRLNETWIKFTAPGVYYGQCSEICGLDHAYMPIEVHAVPKETFAEWAKLAKTDVEAADRQFLGLAFVENTAAAQ